MSKFVSRLKRVLAGWLFVLFVGYVGCMTLFYHTHVINGHPTSHSHPSRHSPDTGGHTHTSSEFVLIAHLSVILMLAAAFGWTANIIIPRAEYHTAPVPASAAGREPLVTPLRGPPVR